MKRLIGYGLELALAVSPVLQWHSTMGHGQGRAHMVSSVFRIAHHPYVQKLRQLGSEPVQTARVSNSKNWNFPKQGKSGADFLSTSSQTEKSSLVLV